MASFVALTVMTLQGTAWTGTAPGDPGSQTPSGTITSTTDWSAWTTEVKMGPKFADIEFTNFGSGGNKVYKPGLFECDMSFVLNQDFAAAQVDVTVAALFFPRPTNPIYFDLKPTNAARGTTNPSIVFAGWISEYPPFGVKVGDAVQTEIPIAVTGAIARLTS